MYLQVRWLFFYLLTSVVLIEWIFFILVIVFIGSKIFIWSFIYLFDEIFNISVGFNSVHICFLMHFSNTYFIVFVRIFQHLCHLGAEVYWLSLCLFPYELRVPWLFCMPSNLWLYLGILSIMLWKSGSSLHPVKTSWWSVNLVLNGFAILHRIRFMHEQVGNVQEFKKSLWALFLVFLPLHDFLSTFEFPGVLFGPLVENLGF